MKIALFLFAISIFLFAISMVSCKTKFDLENQCRRKCATKIIKDGVTTETSAFTARVEDGFRAKLVSCECTGEVK